MNIEITEDDASCHIAIDGVWSPIPGVDLNKPVAPRPAIFSVAVPHDHFCVAAGEILVRRECDGGGWRK